MRPIQFTYQHKTFTATIQSSRDGATHFHWFIFNDPYLLNLTRGEDSICFQSVNGQLRCTSVALRYKAPELVRLAQQEVEKHLEETSVNH